MSSIDLPASCLVDTTYLINLAQPKAQYHANALQYTQALQANQTRFYLPTLVMAEYGVKAGPAGVSAAIATLGAQVCGFDMSAALLYGQLAMKHKTIFNVPIPEKERSVVDLMLVAIAETMDIESIITTDKNIVGQFRKDTSVNAIDLRRSITDLYPLWRDSSNI